MINTHEKLVETILEQQINKEELYEIMYANGYKGTREDMISNLLFAIGATDGYINSPQYHLDGSRDIYEDEYFLMLTDEMNTYL